MSTKRARKFSLVAPTPVAAPHEPRTHDEKIAAAIQYLDRKWVHHPQFVGKKNLANGFLNKWRAQRMVGRGVTVTSKERS